MRIRNASLRPRSALTEPDETPPAERRKGKQRSENAASADAALLAANEVDSDKVVADPIGGQPASKMLHTELVATFEAGPIGAGLGDRGGAVKVLSVDLGSAAEAQGVCAGLIVCEVSGKSTKGLDKRAVIALVKAASRPLQLNFSQDAEAAAETEAVPAAAGATAAHVESRQANCQPERCCGSSSCDRCGSSSESSCECAIAPAGSAAAAWAWSHRFVNEWDEDQEAACAAGVERELQQAMEEIYDKHMAT